MKRVGILGGTFDPLHLGHLRAAEVVRDALGLDRVVFVPAATPPHKTRSDVTDAGHRLRMVELGLEGERFFEVSRIEVDRGGPSYTIDTLDALAAEDPEVQLFFVTGTDAFSEIRTWHRWRELLGRYAFAVHERPGHPVEGARKLLAFEGAPPLFPESDTKPLAGGGPGVHLVRREMIDVSSTGIRSSVREKRSIRFLVPDPVEAYIQEFRLYQ